MAWTVDPSSDRGFHRINAAHIIRNILSEGPLEERDLLGSIMEVSMAYRDNTVSHSDIVWHSYVVKSLIPLQSREAMLLSELICEIESSDPPLTTLASASSLSIIPFSSLLIDYALRVIQSHILWSILLRGGLSFGSLPTLVI